MSRCTRGPASLPQGSLAPAGVVLSPALLAYYDPIRQFRRHAATSPLSRLIRRAFAVRARRGDPRDLPYFHCRTVHTCRRPYAGGSGRPPVTMASRYQASSTSQRVATHNCPSLPAIPDGVKHFGAASFASCCGPCVYLALLTGYDEEEPPRLHLASAELRHSRLDRDMSPPPGESQARWANGKPPIIGTCTRQVTAASEAAREAGFKKGKRNYRPRHDAEGLTYPIGSAARTAALTPSAYDLKFSRNNVASFLAVSSYRPGSLQVAFGTRMSFGAPGHSVTMSSPK